MDKNELKIHHFFFLIFLSFYLPLIYFLFIAPFFEKLFSFGPFLPPLCIDEFIYELASDPSSPSSTNSITLTIDFHFSSYSMTPMDSALNYKSPLPLLP